MTKNNLALKITCIYAFVGGLWILFSDKLLSILIRDSQQMMLIAIFKGWFFVAASAVMIYLLIERDLKVIKKSQQILKERDQKIWYQAYYDTLTGLPNRLLFLNRLADEINVSKKKTNMFAVFFIDLDLFKNINDSLGHAIGDKFLVAVAERLKHIEGLANIFRIGGDEFAILTPPMHSDYEIQELANKTLHAFNAPFVIEDYELYMSMSIGISIYPNDGEDIQHLFKNAHTAMYYAKKSGRNIYQRYNHEMTDTALRRLTIENNLRKALENNELVIHYQPQLDLTTREIIGVEALLRWNNKELGAVSPAEFIPIAEEIGLIIPIGEWVLHQAAEQNQRWIQKGVKPLRLSVNVSIRQFQDSNFIKNVQRILEITGMNARYLNLEITESSIMLNAEKCIERLSDLKNLGVQISVDDFGTGYSSLSYLKRLPIDILKIDRSFIKDVTNDNDIAAIIQAIINMAHCLGLNVVAEGVETEEQNDFLYFQKCNEVQGFLFSKPVPANILEKMWLQL